MMEELVSELERLTDRLWGTDESEAARRSWTRDLCDFVARAGAAADRAARDAEIRHRAALEAYWADKARDFAKSAPEGEDAVRTVDENMAISRAAVKLLAEHGDFLDLLGVFTHGLVRLALESGEAVVRDGEIVFECRDLLAAKKRASALKRLAQFIDDFWKGECGLDVHAAIIAYTA